jgi:hypothetical protein
LESEGKWFWNGNFSWNGYEPNNGDSVSVTGSITSRTDVYGKQYFTIDVLNFTNYLMTSVINSNYKFDTLKALLNQNYPNPFNPTTTILFSLKNSSSTKLSVYNILGREVQVLLNDELSAGNYKINCDGQNLPSGIYIY